MANPSMGVIVFFKVPIFCHWFIALIYLHRLHVQSVCQWQKLIHESSSVHAVALSPAGRTAYVFLPNRLKREQNLSLVLRLCCASRGEVQVELAEFHQCFYALTISGHQVSAR